jgi:methylmalonyl-CoA mutase
MVTFELARQGCEVIDLLCSPDAANIARAAVQEDAQGAWISIMDDGDTGFLREIIAELRARGGRHVRVFAQSQGEIAPVQARAMKRLGITEIFAAGTNAAEIAAGIRRGCAGRPPTPTAIDGDRKLARALTLAERAAGKDSSRDTSSSRARVRKRPGAAASYVAAIAGPGSDSKTTLLDALTRRFLRRNSARRIAVLSRNATDRALPGAILRERALAAHAQNDRVFFRSLAVRESRSHVSPEKRALIEVLRRSGLFDLILVEATDLADEPRMNGDASGARRLFDTVVYVMSPHDGADLIVLNPGADPRARAEVAELSTELNAEGRRHPFLCTVSPQHDETGIDALYAAIADLAGHEPRGGERACHLHIED